MGGLQSSPEGRYVTGSYQICQYHRVMIRLAQAVSKYSCDIKLPAAHRLHGTSRTNRNIAVIQQMGLLAI